MNKSVEPGTIMNALAHMCIGFGSVIGKEELRLTDYRDADGGSHPDISEMPLIVLRANSNKIRKLREEAQANDIHFVDFTDTMTIGSYQEQQSQFLRSRHYMQPLNDREGKAIHIQTKIGKRPVIAVGNSTGDLEMLQLTASHPKVHLNLVLRHDDPKREYQYEDYGHQIYRFAKSRGWTIVSMKDDFKSIF